MRNTTGEAAFDAATRKHLADLRKNPIDCFGQRIKVGGACHPLIATMERGPQRAALLALRTNCKRYAVDQPLEALVACGNAILDQEGFYTLSEEAFGP